MTDTTTKNFDKVATSILRAQKKLGALKGLKATVLTLDDSRKQRLKTAGKYSVAMISTAALVSAGLYLRGKKQGAQQNPLPAPYRRGAGHHKASLKYVPTSGKKPWNTHKKMGTKYDVTDADKKPWNTVKRGARKFVVTDEMRRPGNTHKKMGTKFVPKGSDKIAAKRAEVEAQNKLNRKRGNINKFAAAGVAAAGTAAAGALAGVAGSTKKQTLLIEARYAYGTKLFEVARLTDEEVKSGVDKKILREVTAAVASLKTAKEWTVKESASVDYLNLAVLGETLIEDVLESQLLEDADVVAAATKAARDVSDFEDVEDDEEVEEGYLFEDEDCDDSDEDEEDEDSDDDKEEELDEEVFFETDMFKI